MRHTRKTHRTKLAFLTTVKGAEINYIPFQSFLENKKKKIKLEAWQKSGSVLFQKMLKLYVRLLISDQDRMSRHEETLWIGGRMCRQPPIQQLHGLESIRHAACLWLNPLKFQKVSAARGQSSCLHHMRLTNSTCSSNVTSESFRGRELQPPQKQQLK